MKLRQLQLLAGFLCAVGSASLAFSTSATISPEHHAGTLEASCTGSNPNRHSRHVAPDASKRITPRNGIEFASGEFAHGNHEDRTLEAKPPEIEAGLPDDVAAARFSSYITEPTFQPARVTVEYTTSNESDLAPGYYFIAPFDCGTVGPQIFDQYGELVYWGASEANNHQVKNFMPCLSPGGTLSQLCWSEVHWDEYHHEYVINRVFDDTYTQIGTDYGAAQGSVDPNPHEFSILAGGKSFIQIVYKIKLADLKTYGIPGEGWVHDGCFEEIDVVSKKLLFSWCALDHIPLDETYLYPNIRGQQNFTEGIAGLGTFRRSWDFAHMNSADKLPNGDYLISMRHLNSVFKVAGNSDAVSAAGTVLWHLNGKSNDFEFLNNFTFFRQHHARYLSSHGNTLIISLFNNAFTVRNPTALQDHASSGQIISVNEETMTAELIHDYVHPHAKRSWRKSVTLAGGSVDVQSSSGGAVVGWGTIPDVSEYSENGKLLFHANIGNHSCSSYRAWKKPWIGMPKWSPKLVVYTKSCESAALVAHASWNGATEVVAWRFSVSTSKFGPWLAIGTFQKMGFETRADLRESQVLRSLFDFVPYVLVEALDAHRNVLGTTMTATFVPLAHHQCDEDHCMWENITYEASQSNAHACHLSSRSLVPAIVVLIVLLVCLEFSGWVVHRVLQHWWQSASRIDCLARRFHRALLLSQSSNCNVEAGGRYDSLLYEDQNEEMVDVAAAEKIFQMWRQRQSLNHDGNVLPA